MANLNSPKDLGFALRDYHHAAKTFTQEPGYTKTPYTGFNFHVNISFNNLLGRLRRLETKDISVLVRAADLPETQFETETLNQYNRKRIINKRVVYQPIKLEFHDDIANNIRNMWIAYNQHYNADSNYSLNSTWNIDDVYANYSLNRRYGLDSGNSLPFINKIEIFSMGNNEYSKMLLVNPIINSAQFDDHDYSDGAKTMALNLTVEYENIIYSAGTTDQISNFGANNTENYDQNSSSLDAIDLSRNLTNNVNEQTSKPDTPVESSTSSTDAQTSAQQVDSVSGNVSKSYSNSNTRLTQDQYNQVKQRITESSRSTNYGNEYLFPDTRIGNNSRQSSTGNTTQNTSVNYNSVIQSSRNVSSNGSNVSSSVVVNSNNTGINTNGRTTPHSTSVSQNTGEIFIRPIIPDGLTDAERAIFLMRYEPLPSTDRRTSQPPYVSNPSSNITNTTASPQGPGVNLTALGRNLSTSALNSYLKSTIPGIDFTVRSSYDGRSIGSNVDIVVDINSISKTDAIKLFNSITSALSSSGIREIFLQIYGSNGRTLAADTYSYY